VFEVQLSNCHGRSVVRHRSNYTSMCALLGPKERTITYIPEFSCNHIATVVVKAYVQRVKMNQRVYARPASTVRCRHRVVAHAAKAGDAAAAPQRIQQVSDLPGTSFYSLELELREAMNVQA
jgi:hypothetical protein